MLIFGFAIIITPRFTDIYSEINFAILCYHFYLNFSLFSYTICNIESKIFVNIYQFLIGGSNNLVDLPNSCSYNFMKKYFSAVPKTNFCLKDVIKTPTNSQYSKWIFFDCDIVLISDNHISYFDDSPPEILNIPSLPGRLNGKNVSFYVFDPFLMDSNSIFPASKFLTGEAFMCFLESLGIRNEIFDQILLEIDASDDYGERLNHYIASNIGLKKDVHAYDVLKKFKDPNMSELLPYYKKQKKRIKENISKNEKMEIRKKEEIAKKQKKVKTKKALNNSSNVVFTQFGKCFFIKNFVKGRNHRILKKILEEI